MGFEGVLGGYRLSLSNYNPSVCVIELLLSSFPPNHARLRRCSSSSFQDHENWTVWFSRQQLTYKLIFSDIVAAVNSVMLVVALCWLLQETQSVTAGNLGGKWPPLQYYYMHYSPIV